MIKRRWVDWAVNAFQASGWLLLLFPLLAMSAAHTGVQPVEVIKRAGTYKSMDGKCSITLSVSEKGGFTQITLSSQDKRNRIVDDVTGASFLSRGQVVFTVSPLYGKPGVYIYDCLSKHAKRIVSPKTRDKAYPNGADYYELQGWRSNRIFFYYAPDVDSIEFANFRTSDFLYEVHSDGSGFRRVEQR